MMKESSTVGVVITVQGGCVAAVDATEPVRVVLVDQDVDVGPEWQPSGTLMWETWQMYAREASEEADVEVQRESETLERRWEVRQ